MMEVKLDDEITVSVDLETAQQLKDTEFAASYLKMIRHEIARESNPHNMNETTSRSEKTTECTLWKSKYPTKVDDQATLIFLALRKQYDKEFLDKKTSKNHLWSKIQEQMNEMGYFVGDAVAGREKCRQKFSNLQSTYFKMKERRRRTGEGKIIDPPYFKELDEILGDRHNTQPLLLVDSLKSSVEASCSSKTNNEVNSTTSNTSKDEDTRFGSKKQTVKPPTPRNKALEELIAIQRENQTERREEFQAMMDFFTQQNMNRHQEMIALINRPTNGKSTKKSK